MMSKQKMLSDVVQTEQEAKHAGMARKLSSMGMVLLENRGSLPLTNTGGPIALFGNGVRGTVKGGSGSGDVNCREVVCIEQAFQEAGFRITSGHWLDRYEDTVRQARLAWLMGLQERIAKEGMSAALDFLFHPFRVPPVLPAKEEDLSKEADTAIYVLSRSSGEGADRRPAEGEYALYQEEKALLDQLIDAYRQVILVLNVGGVVDSSYFKDNEKIGAVLLMGQGGINGARALVDVLTGKVTPSGHLAATWATDYMDYPGADSFSHMNGNLDDEYYREGIYVGYRFFDRFRVKAGYPFGFGLSYTDFSVETTGIEADEKEIRLAVRVKNIGDTYSGREVIQVYASAPEGALDKPVKELVAFGKTGELAPGGEEELHLSFETAQMASYDEDIHAWVMEKGAYLIQVGVNCEKVDTAARLVLDETVIVCRTGNHLQGDRSLKEFKLPKMPHSSLSVTDENLAAVPQFRLAPCCISGKAEKKPIPENVLPGSRGFITWDQVRRGEASLQELAEQLSEEELAAMCVGALHALPGGDCMIGMASNTVPGAAGDTSSVLMESRGVPNLILADGPAGLRLATSFAVDAQGHVIPGTESSPVSDFDMMGPVNPDNLPAGAGMRYQYCTAIPVATVLAQTWDLDAIEAAGDLVGEEMEQFGVHLWLAPGMNIQRNPLCGRNFEYYSEDPFLSGKCAAAMVRGVQKHPGCGTTIKHFACNNQEDNRTHTNAHVSERALREIYLKGFEIAIREAQPKALMTSYNLLNGVHTANHYDLITSVARQEWGFEGLVMTDWGTTGRMELLATGEEFKYGCSSAAGCIRSGNDLIMPGSQGDIDEIIRAVRGEQDEKTDGIPSLSMEELRACAKRVLKTILDLT